MNAAIIVGGGIITILITRDVDYRRSIGSNIVGILEEIANAA